MRIFIATTILLAILGSTTVLSMGTKPARTNDPPIADVLDAAPPHLDDLVNDPFDTYR